MINMFVVSIILGTWSVILFPEKEIGLSMILFVVPFIYYLIHILEKNNKIVSKKAKLLIIPIILLASTYFIYNNKFFYVVNIIAIVLLIAYMIYRMFNEEVKCGMELIKNTIGVYFSPLGFLEKTFDRLSESFAERKSMKKKKQDSQKMVKIAKAIGITLPILIIVLILLSSADEIFGSIFKEIEKGLWKIIIEINIINLISRILFAIIITIYLLTFFNYLIKKYKKQESNVKKAKVPKDNFTIKVILGTLNLVYLIFCIIQVKSLFMGKVENYANYARQGFFQLMLVSLINLITILIAKKSENEGEKRGNIYINTMSIIMIVFTLIILLSSAMRMNYYESAYGFTLLRLLVYCTLFTEVLLLIPTIAYVLNAKFNLPKVYFTIIIIVYVCMNFANFDALIAKRNVTRFVKTGKIDVEYLTEKTSTDAVKQILDLLKMQEIKGKDRDDLARYIDKLSKKLENEKMDFRDFNLSKIYAKSLMKDNPDLYVKYFDNRI